MREQPDILDTAQPLRGPMFRSLGLHGAVAVALILSTYASLKTRESWGDPNSLGGGAFSVTPVRQIQMATPQGPVNRVANDTPSQVPAPPKPEPKQTVKEAPDAIRLRSKDAKAAKPEPRRNIPSGPVTGQRPLENNQMTSRAGQAASSPIYGMAPGSGGVGVGTGMPFGSRFGGYAAIVRDRVAQKWRTNEVDARLNTAPPVIVIFEIQRTGVVSNIRVVQSSGMLALDNSARRAVAEASPFPPLPVQYEGGSASIEFWFQLKR